MRDYSAVMQDTRPRRFLTVSRSIRYAAQPQATLMSDTKRYCNAVLMLALGQCAQDIIQDFSNLPSIKGKFMASKAEIASQFNQQRKALYRGVTKEEAAQFDAVVCEVTDLCQQRTKWLVATVKGELTNKVIYSAVEPGALLGIAHGLCQCCNRIHRKMTGKNSSIFTRVMEELLSIDDKIQSDYLNEAKKVDWDVVSDAIIVTVEDMVTATKKVLKVIEKGGEK